MSALLRRHYDAPVEDVWDAVTDPNRMKRWLLPVSGDLREGDSLTITGTPDQSVGRVIGWLSSRR